MKKYTNTILIGLYGLGAAFMLITIVIVRFNLDRAIELTV